MGRQARVLASSPAGGSGLRGGKEATPPPLAVRVSTQRPPSRRRRTVARRQGDKVARAGAEVGGGLLTRHRVRGGGTKDGTPGKGGPPPHLLPLSVGRLCRGGAVIRHRRRAHGWCWADRCIPYPLLQPASRARTSARDRKAPAAGGSGRRRPHTVGGGMVMGGGITSGVATVVVASVHPIGSHSGGGAPCVVCAVRRREEGQRRDVLRRRAPLTGEGAVRCRNVGVRSGRGKVRSRH